MSQWGKGLLISPFLLMILISCVTAPETVVEKEEEKKEETASSELPAEDPISFYKGPEDAAEAIRVMENLDEGEMDRDSRFIYYSLLISNNDIEKAVEQLEILLADNPDDTEALSAYISLMDYLEENDKRDESLDRLIALEPDNSFAINMKGSFALRDKNYGVADKLFLKSISIDPDNAESYIGRGNALMHMEDREEESVALFEQAERIDPDNPFIYSDRSRVYRFLKDYGRAEDDMTRAISLYPSEWNYLDRARIRISDLDDRSGAMEDLLAIMEIDKDNFFANVYLAGLYDDEREYDMALFHYEKVLSLADDYQYAYPALGKLYYIKEDYGKAAQMYEKAVLSGLNEMTYPLMAYLCHYKNGNEKAGRLELNRHIGKLDRSSSIYEMYRYYQSPSSPYFVQMAIDKDKDETMRDRMKYYMAMIDSIHGRDETARAIFGEIAERRGAYEFELASLEMEKK